VRRNRSDTSHRTTTEVAVGDRPLRVVLAVESGVVPAWVASLAADLGAAPELDVRLAQLPPEDLTPPDRLTPALRMYETVDALLFPNEGKALELVTLREHVSQLAECEACDVVVAHTSAGLARWRLDPTFGVWEVSHRTVRGERSEPLLFWECLRGEVVETRIDSVASDGRRRTLYRSYGASDDASLRRGRDRALWKAAGAVSYELRRLHRDRSHFLDVPWDSAAVGQAPRVGSWDVVRFFARGVRAIVRRRARRYLYEEPWFIGARARGGQSPLGASAGTFRRIDPPRGRAFADPFAFDHEGRTFVLFEDLDEVTGRARISYLTLDESAHQTGERGVALEAPFHLSYPHVFRSGSDIFMIPESSEDHTVTLYRATSFPREWVVEDVLLRGVAAVDTTVFEHAGRFWLFTAVFSRGASPNDDLHLFSARDLRGPWEPHPANPVVADVRRARPAGPLFHRGDELIRPSQDCSRVYGGSIVLNRVDVLTIDEYRETPVDVIEPTWDGRLQATHTYSRSERVEVIDGRRLVRRRWFRRGGS
jgi:hypothetical protein